MNDFQHDFQPDPRHTPSQPSPVTTALVGPFGLRAGWALLLFLALVALFGSLLSVSLLALQGKHTAPKKSPPAQTIQPASPQLLSYKDQLAGDSILLLSLALAGLVLASIEHRRIGVYGIASNRLLDFLPGAFWGIACMSLLIFTLHSSHLLAFDARALSALPALTWGLKWLFTFLVVGVFEEYLFRGYVQFTLTRGFFGLAHRLSAPNARLIAFWTAATVFSLTFLISHWLTNTAETPVGLLSIFGAGMVFSYALWRTGSLWWAIGFHTAWDWSQSFLFGVPDSGVLSIGRLWNTHPAGSPILTGGVTGPEGSVFVLPAFLLIAILIRFTTRPGTQPPLQPIGGHEIQASSSPATPA